MVMSEQRHDDGFALYSRYFQPVSLLSVRVWQGLL